jgi:hypothetical protein
MYSISARLIQFDLFDTGVVCSFLLEIPILLAFLAYLSRLLDGSKGYLWLVGL